MCFHEQLQSRVTEVAGELCAIDLNIAARFHAVNFFKFIFIADSITDGPVKWIFVFFFISFIKVRFHYIGDR